MHSRQAAEQQMHTKIHYTNWYLNEYIHSIITRNYAHILLFLSSNYVEFVVKSEHVNDCLIIRSGQFESALL